MWHEKFAQTFRPPSPNIYRESKSAKFGLILNNARVWATVIWKIEQDYLHHFWTWGASIMVLRTPKFGVVWPTHPWEPLSGWAPYWNFKFISSSLSARACSSPPKVYERLGSGLHDLQNRLRYFAHASLPGFLEGWKKCKNVLNDQ